MPDKSLNEVSRPLREAYEKGKQALARNNVDYAFMYFEQVLQKEPAFYECREALRAAQFKKAGTTSTGFFKKMLGNTSSQPAIAKGHLALRKDPIEALTIAEQILNGDPNSAAAHKLLVDAARAADFPRAALLSIEILVKASPGNRQLKMEQAELLAQLNDIARAEAVYTELLNNDPNDAEISAALKNLSARQTMDQGGYATLADGQGSYRDALKDKDEAVSLEQQNRQNKSEDVTGRLITEYEARVVAEPGNLRLFRNLAELHTQKKDYDKALEYYNQIRSSESGSDPSLDRAIADAIIRRFEYKQSQLDPNAADYQEQLAAIETERQAYQLSECKARAEKYPTDLQIRFELAQLFLQAGKISEAIQEFQKSQNHPQRRTQAMTGLAQCFSRRNMNDMAARKLQEALKEKPGFDDEKKEMIYLLGCVLEKMGKKEEAMEQFKIIYESDISYKDVAVKVEAYYSEQGS